MFLFFFSFDNTFFNGLEFEPFFLKIAATLDGYQICGNYDADSCLEWGTVTSCNVGQTCSNGNCVSPQVCTPGTIQTGTTCNVCNSQGIGYTQDNSRCLQGYFCDKTIYKCCDATGNCY